MNNRIKQSCLVLAAIFASANVSVLADGPKQSNSKTQSHIDSSSAKTSATKAQSKAEPRSNTTVASKVPQANADDLKSKPASYWKNKLDGNTYNVTRCSGTELPFTGKYWNEHTPGAYLCSNCGENLFDSKDKFNSGTGWPSFTKPAGSVEVHKDTTLGMQRDEVVCKHCGAHLGHVFDDGPAPTGTRYCINSASLNLKPSEKNR